MVCVVRSSLRVWGFVLYTLSFKCSHRWREMWGLQTVAIVLWECSVICQWCDTCAMNSHIWLLVLLHFSVIYQCCINKHVLSYTIQQHACLVYLYLQYESAGKYCRKFWCHFPWEPVPCKQSTLIGQIVYKNSITVRQKPDRKHDFLTKGEWTILVLEFKLHQENPLNG